MRFGGESSRRRRARAGLRRAGLLVLVGLAALGAATTAAAAPALTGPITAIACPSASLCLATDGSGNILWSSDPGAGAAAWQYARIDAGPEGGQTSLNGLACPSTTLCVAVDGQGRIYTSTNPTGGASAWRAGPATGTLLTSATCPNVGFCAVAGYPSGSGPSIYTTDTPAAGSASTNWSAAAPLDASGGLPAFTGISCLSEFNCVAAERGEVAASSSPDGGTYSWSFAPGLDSGLADVHVACPDMSLCVLASSQIVTTTNPGPGATWTSVNSPRGMLTALTCPSPSLCLATAGNTIVTSQNPTGGAGAWSAATTLNDVLGSGEALSAVGCAGTGLCLAGNIDGYMWSTTDPLGPSSRWAEFRPGGAGGGEIVQTGRPHVHGFTIAVRFRASGLPGATAKATAVLRSNFIVGHGRRRHRIALGTAQLRLAAPAAGTLVLPLNARGRSLWHARHGLSTLLDIGAAEYVIDWNRRGRASVHG